MAYSDVLENNRVHDTYRIVYLSAHIKEVLRAKEEGYPVFGYCPWSFTIHNILICAIDIN